MSQMPIEPTSLDKILRSVGAVKTKGGFAALNLILVFSFGIGVLMFASNMDISKMILTILVFLCWQGFAIYAFVKLPHSSEVKEKQRTTQKVSKK